MVRCLIFDKHWQERRLWSQKEISKNWIIDFKCFAIFCALNKISILDLQPHSIVQTCTLTINKMFTFFKSTYQSKYN